MSPTMIENWPTHPPVIVGDRFVSVPIGWTEPEWNALISHDELATSLWVDHKDTPGVGAMLAAIPRAEVRLGRHRSNPVGGQEGAACGCEEAGRWCPEGDGRTSAFVVFDRRDLAAALWQLGAITRGWCDA